MPLGSLISAGASLVGGLFGQSSQEKQMEKQIQMQEAFAKRGIRWRVKDAQAAGIHPLYALGANTHQFSPIGVGSSPLAEGISQAGQSIGRAVSAKATAPERAFQQRMMELQLQRGELENQLLASQIARANSPSQLPPKMPMIGSSNPEGLIIDGQGDGSVIQNAERFAGPRVEDNPMARNYTAPGKPHSEPGTVADVGWSRTPSGGYAPVKSADFAERSEDSLAINLAWALRNMAIPTVSPSFGSPPFKAPKGQKWTYNIFDQAWHLVRSGNSRNYKSGGSGW